MLKKSLIMASLVLFASATVCLADDVKVPCDCKKEPCDCAQKAPDFKRPPKGPDFAKRHAEFEQRLKLTDEQKAKAEDIRKQGFEKMKPVMEKLKEKKAEIKAVEKTKLLQQDKDAKIEQLRKEIGALKREMHEIKMQNMKNFESILDKKQLKELKKMKKEGRKKFEKEFKKHHKDGIHPPFPPQFGPKHVPTPLPLSEG